MRGSRLARSLTAALLVGSSVLAVLGAAQRWSGVCSDSWTSEACWERRGWLYNQLLPTAPFAPVGRAAELLGLGSLLLAGALVLMPAALGRRSTRWQVLSVGLAALVLAVVGALTILAGVTDRAVDVPGLVVLEELYYWGLAFLVPIGLFPLDADRRAVGPLGGLIVWVLTFALPLPQIIFLSGYSDEMTPWGEAGPVPPLLLVALLLRPWSRQRSFSNQQRAHSLSL